MGYLKQSHWIITFLGIYHAINFVIVFFIFLFLVPRVCAQEGDGESPNGFVTRVKIELNPGTIIILIGLFAVFISLIYFAIYGRSCFQINSGEDLVSIDIIGRPPLLGLDIEVIDTFPTFLYSDVKGLKIGQAVLECAVCLNEFEDQETLRLLPKCCHVFHPKCIDTWLMSHVTCPVCRADLVLVLGEENDFNILTGSTQPRVHEIGELAVDLRVGSHEIIELSQSTNQNRPPRSTQKRSILDGKLPRSHSTGHSLVQPGEDCERFTLRISPNEQKKLNKPELRRAKSKQESHEQFHNENRLKRWGLTMSPPFISRFVQMSKESGNAQNSTANGSVLMSAKVTV